KSISRARMGAEGRSGEHHHAGIFSGGAEPQIAVQRRWFSERPHEIDLGAYTDEPVWRGAGTRGRGGVSCEFEGERLCDGFRYSRGWRVFESDDLRNGLHCKLRI